MYTYTYIHTHCMYRYSIYILHVYAYMHNTIIYTAYCICMCNKCYCIMRVCVCIYIWDPILYIYQHTTVFVNERGAIITYVEIPGEITTVPGNPRTCGPHQTFQVQSSTQSPSGLLFSYSSLPQQRPCTIPPKKAIYRWVPLPQGVAGALSDLLSNRLHPASSLSQVPHGSTISGIY